MILMAECRVTSRYTIIVDDGERCTAVYECRTKVTDTTRALWCVCCERRGIMKLTRRRVRENKEIMEKWKNSESAKGKLLKRNELNVYEWCRYEIALTKRFVLNVRESTGSMATVIALHLAFSAFTSPPLPIHNAHTAHSTEYWAWHGALVRIRSSSWMGGLRVSIDCQRKNRRRRGQK